MPQEQEGRRVNGNGGSGSGNDIIQHSLARTLENGSSQESSTNKASPWTRTFCDTNEVSLWCDEILTSNSSSDISSLIT